MLNEHNAAELMNEAAVKSPRYPGGHIGRGIVIPAGGLKYFACAWVCVNRLRDLGCKLPIELWHLGAHELSDEMRALIEPLGVACVDAYDVRSKHPARILNGWELKPYAIIHSTFQEVLLLDADNVPVIDPTFLFDSPEFISHAAAFWLDYGCLAPTRDIWRLTGIPYQKEREFETGQVLVDKARCWEALSLTMWMNEHSDFWYRHIHGDKETFHMAWRKLERSYAMPCKGIESLDGIMCQHDFHDNRIFQHRNSHKWNLFQENVRIPGFVHEAECLAHLAELRRCWDGEPRRSYDNQLASEAEKAAAGALCAKRWIYRRVGHDERPMTFTINGKVAVGAAGCERRWHITTDEAQLVLCIQGEHGLTCMLTNLDGRRWRGQWEIFERMPVELMEEMI